jgi:NADH:ubiquinone reductase (H+-translocating)
MTSRRITVEELLLTAVVLIVAAVGPNIFPAAQAGSAKMSTLAKEFLLPSLVIFVIALTIAKAWGKSRFFNLVIAGMISGITATFALEVVRESGFRLGLMPGSLPKLMGVLLTDRFLQGPSLFSNVVGWAYHFWNGACFGMIYALIFGRTRWWYGSIYGLVIGIGFMVSPSVTALGIGYFGLQFGWGFPVTVTLAHLAFGTVLGLSLNRFISKDSSGLFNQFIKKSQYMISEYTTNKVNPQKASKRILILGGGFAGMYTALYLERIFAKDKDIEITLVNRDNFFLFTPMLSEVPSSGIEAKHVISPIRAFFNKVSFQQVEVHSIDLKKHLVICSHCPVCAIYQLEYDYLVLALGSVTNFFGLPGVAENSFPMKALADAMALRNHVIDMFEHADLEKDVETRRRLLTFVVAGGGFAGVEVAAELNDFVHVSRKLYKNLHPDDLKLILVVGGSRIMPEISDDLAVYALDKLRKRGIKFYINTRLVDAGENKVELDDGNHISIPTNTLIWTAGVSPDPIIQTLPCEKDKRGKIMVNEYLEVLDLPGVWALGDCAHIPDPETGNPFPPTAQHAVREGKQTAKNIAATILGKDQDKRPFKYTPLGTLAPLGHRTAVAEIMGFKFSGFFAWWLWRTIYLTKLPGLDRKIRVAIDWTLNLFFQRDIVQLKVFMKPALLEKSSSSEENTLKKQLLGGSPPNS